MQIPIPLSAINDELLHEELVGAFPEVFTGVSTGSLGVVLHVKDDTPPPVVGDLMALAMRHDARKESAREAQARMSDEALANLRRAALDNPDDVAARLDAIEARLSRLEELRGGKRIEVGLGNKNTLG